MNEIIVLNDKKYEIKRVIPSDMVTDIVATGLLSLIKQLKGCDLVLKKNGKHYFVAEIEDVEWENV